MKRIVLATGLMVSGGAWADESPQAQATLACRFGVLTGIVQIESNLAPSGLTNTPSFSDAPDIRAEIGTQSFMLRPLGNYRFQLSEVEQLSSHFARPGVTDFSGTDTQIVFSARADEPLSINWKLLGDPNDCLD